jgi:endonuclease YncB( thermonuclease family)/DNA polymerase III epsilon subunit-like protein
LAVSKDDYKHFVKTGKVSDSILNDIAEKVRTHSSLTPEELSIFSDKTSQVESILQKQYSSSPSPKTNSIFSEGYSKPLREASSLEELHKIAEAGREQYPTGPFWQEFKTRKRELSLSQSPNVFLSKTGEELYGIPVNPRTTQSSLGKERIKRDLYGQLFTRKQLEGIDPISNTANLTNKGINYSEFLGKQKQSAAWIGFDLETTGLLKDFSNKRLGSHIGLLSMGTTIGGSSGITEQQLHLGTLDPNRPKFGDYIEGSIIPKHLQLQEESSIAALKKAGVNVSNNISEKDILSSFIGNLEKNKNASLLGYNIKNFDIPFMEKIAERHGLSGQLASAMGNRNVIDVADYAKAFLSERFYNKYVGWQEGSFSQMGRNPAGWQLEAVAHGFGFDGSTGGAHTPLQDTLMTEHVYKSLTGQNPERVFNEQRYLEKMKALGNELTPMSEFEKLTTIKEGKRYLSLPKEAIPPLKLGTAGEEIRESLFSKGKSFALKNKGKLAIGVGLLAVGGLLFSGKDDEYNTIEALQHGNMAEGIRRTYTDFGSGYRGLPSSLMGVEIDPEILSYKRDIIQTGKYKDVEAELKRREKEQQENVGSLGDSDFKAKRDLNLDTIIGINYRNRRLRQVRLEQFNINVEDADTLVLKRKGIFGFFSKDIQIRLAGIDAPESASHEADPLDPVRIWQEQPEAEESSEKLRELIAQQKNLSLIVGGERTYGRYVGALIGDKSALNIDLASIGAVSALPFGSESEDVLSRTLIESEQKKAQRQNLGIWSLARYKAVDLVQDTIRNPITFNTITRIDKMAQNLNLAAYGSFLEDLGTERRNLTPDERETAKRIGYVLRKTHGPRKRYYNQKEKGQKFSAMPNSGTMAAEIREQFTEFKKDFASRWDPARNIAASVFKGTKGRKALNLLKKTEEWKTMLSTAEQLKELSYGSYGTTYLMEGTFRGEKFKFVKKVPNTKIVDENSDFLTGGPSKEKRIAALKKEASVMPIVQDRIAPSVYGFDEETNALYMELMPGKTLHELHQEGTKIPINKILKEIKQEAKKVAKQGVKNTDIHSNNIMYDPETGKISWIDWGIAESSTGSSKELLEKNSAEMAEAITKKLTPQIKAKINPKREEEGFFEMDFGSFNSMSSKAKQSFRDLSQNSVGVSFRASRNAVKHGSYSSVAQ